MLTGRVMSLEDKMSRGMPSITALLGLLAVAGYQNRDKLAEMLKGATSGNQAGGVPNNLGWVGCSAIWAEC